MSKRDNRAFRELSPSRQPTVGFGRMQAVVPLNDVLWRVASKLPPNEKVLVETKLRRGGSANNARRRFTADEVRALRGRHIAGEGPTALAKEAGVTVGCMEQILNGITYAWVI